LRIRKSHNVIQPWNTFSMIQRKKNITSLSVKDVSKLQAIYKEPHPIKKEKIENLKDMCQYIPLEYREFYHNLKSVT
jgi:hypothetical protein